VLILFLKVKRTRRFLCLTFIETVVVFIITIVTLVNALNGNSRTDAYLSIIILVSLIFFVYFAFHGIYRSNKFEIMVVLFELGLVEIYVIYTFVIHLEAGTLQASHYAAIILISMITLCIVIVSIKIIQRI